MNKFILDLTDTTSMTFVCKNATKNDVSIIMFEWSLFEIFNSNAYLYKIHPHMSFDDLMAEINTYSNNKIYRIDVHCHCTLPFIVKSEHQICCGSSADQQSSSNTTIATSLTTHEKWQLPPNDFDSYTLIPFEYSEGLSDSHHSMYVKQLQWARKASSIADLVREIIDNGYENDLLPRDDYSREVLQDDNIFPIDTTTMIQRLRLKYKIFDILGEKLDHGHHLMMGSPLKQFPVLLLGLLLQCNGQCNYAMNRALRDNNQYSHWKYLACAISTGVFILNKFQRFHNLSIFSGSCNVFLDPRQAMQPNERIRGHLRSTVSFSTDLIVAKQFRGDSGMLMELKLDDSINYNICMADVSWVSIFSDEKEVLVIDLPLDIAPSQCFTQWNGNDTKQFISLTPGTTPENLFCLDQQLPTNIMANINGADIHDNDNIQHPMLTQQPHNQPQSICVSNGDMIKPCKKLDMQVLETNKLLIGEYCCIVTSITVKKTVTKLGDESIHIPNPKELQIVVWNGNDASDTITTTIPTTTTTTTTTGESDINVSQSLSEELSMLKNGTRTTLPVYSHNHSQQVVYRAKTHLTISTETNYSSYHGDEKKSSDDSDSEEDLYAYGMRDKYEFVQQCTEFKEHQSVSGKQQHKSPPSTATTIAMPRSDTVSQQQEQQLQQESQYKHQRQVLFEPTTTFHHTFNDTVDVDVDSNTPIQVGYHEALVCQKTKHSIAICTKNI